MTESEAILERFAGPLTIEGEAATIKLANEFAAFLEPGDVVCLVGDLGAGKTHFSKGVAQYFGINPAEVTSPTFTLIHEYYGELPVYHFDCYRLEDVAEAVEIGIREYIDGDGICLIEWPQVIAPLIPDYAWEVRLTHLSENSRNFTLSRFKNSN